MDMKPERKEQEKKRMNENEKRDEGKTVLTSFSIEPDKKRKYEELFHEMGLSSWANGIRFALAEFYRTHKGGQDA